MKKEQTYKLGLIDLEDWLEDVCERTKGMVAVVFNPQTMYIASYTSRNKKQFISTVREQGLGQNSVVAALTELHKRCVEVEM